MFQIFIGCMIAVISFFAGRFIQKDKNNKKYLRQKKLSEKHLDMFLLMNKWIQNKDANKEIADYLSKLDIHSAAIYGMNYIGQTLCMELKNTSIEIKYGIDRNAENIYAECDLFLPEDELPMVDLVIVTPLNGFEEIKEKIEKKLSCKIISIEDIIYGL